MLSTACLEERPRPAPPLLRVTLHQTEVTSPDTLTGILQAEDRDGIDSVWVTVDEDRAGHDGFFETQVVANFRFLIPVGLPASTVLPVRLEARDLAGMRSQIDTLVVVIP